MQTEVVIDASEVLSFMERLSGFAPRAQEVAINRTVEEILAGARKLAKDNLTVRAANFILPPVQLPRHWRADARKNRLEAMAAWGDYDGRNSIGARRSIILSKFDRGGTKTASATNNPIAIPTKALRSSPSTLIPRKMYPRNLVGTFDKEGGFTGLGRSARFRVSRRPRQVGRYFVLGGPNQSGWGLFERTGPGDRDIRKLWTFKQSIPIPRRLPFLDMAEQIVDERFTINMMGAIELALSRGWK